MGGIGFLGDAAQAELGPSNAGLDPELDNMADYLMHVEALARSPYRDADGALSEAAVRGAGSGCRLRELPCARDRVP